MPEVEQLDRTPIRRIRRASSNDAVADAFRDSMSQLAATVVMVTCQVQGRPWGLTISACCSVSVSPPMVLISLGSHTATAATIREQGHFGVSILGQRGRDAARAGSRPGAPKFVDDFCHDDACDLPTTPIVRGSVAHLDCEAVQETEVLDHVIFFGRVTDVVTFVGERPLIYYARDYTELNHEEPWWC